MLSTDYLIQGITGLARCGTVETQIPNGTLHRGGGHPAAAILAAYYMSREQALDSTVEPLLAAHADDIIRCMPQLFTPFSAESAQPALLAALEEGLERCLDAGYPWAIHGVIYGAYALRALRDLPEQITPTIVHGVRAAQEVWATQRFPALTYLEAVVVEPGDDTPVYETEHDMIAATLQELSVIYPNLNEDNAVVSRYPGALLKGHLVTFTHAVCELEAMGYSHLAERGIALQRQQLKASRVPPPDPDRHRIDDTPFASILDPSYWAAPKRNEGVLSINCHALKMPRAALSLLSRLSTAEQAAYEPFVCRLMTQYV